MPPLSDYAYLILSLGWASYLVILAIWIILQKRPPLSTLAWVLSLAALPVLGFVIYFFLGPQKITRQRLRRQRLRQMHQVEACADPAAAAAMKQRKRGLSRLVEKSTGTPVSSATRIDLLVGGDATYAALLQAIGEAKRHVHLQYYIFNPDSVGREIRDALIERAQAGVEVRLLVDAVGSSRLRHRFLAPLLAAGAEFARFHPFRLATLRPLLNLRTHRKIVVIDGEVGFTGGINIADEQDSRLSAGAWQDLHLRLDGQVVGWLQAVFVEDWLYASGRSLPETGLYPSLPSGRYPTQVLASGPDTETETMHRAFLQAINDSRQRVWLATPYFAPGEAALYALSNAALRGIDVRLLLPRRSDSRIVTYAARSYYEQLIARGIQIYEFQPSILHTKALLVDDDCAIIGSANFDQRSFRLNFEVGVAIFDSEFVVRLADQLEQDMGRSLRIHLPRPLSLGQRLGEAAARLLTPLL